MVRRQTLLGLTLVAVIVAGSAFVGWTQAGVDPQSLLGEWTGKWVYAQATGGRRAGGTTGPYALTVKRVEGERVAATLDVLGQTWDIRARLFENRLTFGNEQFQTELMVDGDQMRGRRQGSGSIPWLIELTKKK
jgi:hypothetical protein